MPRFQLSRRAMLRSAGAMIALPQLEIMADEPAAAAAGRTPRMICLYVPLGIHTKKWYPVGTGNTYRLSPSLQDLAPHREQMSILTGLEHIEGKQGAHYKLDNFLTGCDLYPAGSAYRNGVSVDQLASGELCRRTYLPSLVLSGCAGIGRPSLAHTLSYNPLGRPLPARNKPREIFASLFPPAEAHSRQALDRRLDTRRSILDLVADGTRSLQSHLGRRDSRRLDEYLQTIREVESRIAIKRGIIADPPTIKQDPGIFDADEVMPADEYTSLMLDLICLALQTDMTRVVTYAFCSENGSSYFRKNASKHITGAKKEDWHGYAHRQTAELAIMDRWFAGRLAYLIKRLSELRDGEHSLLDQTTILYGYGQSKTHDPVDLPLILAGGKALGFRHGQHHRFNPDRKRPTVPMANLLLTMLRRVGVAADNFADSTGDLTELL